MKKFLAIAIIILSLFALTGCGAEINYYYSGDDYEYNYEYEIVLDTALVNELQQSAIVRNAVNGEKWTLNGYFSTMSAAFGYDYAYGEGTDRQTYTLTKTVAVEDIPSDDEEEDDTKVEVTPHFFTREYKYTAPHPLVEAVQEYKNGSAQPGTLFYVLDNGLTNASGAVVLAPLKTAFPALNDKDLSQLKLNFYWKNDALKTTDGETVRVGHRKYLKWTAQYDGEEKTISYTARGVNPLGWYVVITVLAVAATVTVILVCKKRSNRGKMVEEKVTPKFYIPPTPQSNNNGSGVTYVGGGSPLPDVFDDSEDKLRKQEETKRERERMLKRVDEFFPPEQAAEIKKKMLDEWNNTDNGNDEEIR